jgi:hypothetical protein
LHVCSLKTACKRFVLEGVAASVRCPRVDRWALDGLDENGHMDLQIALLLGQDGITNGAIYALLSLALVLVFAVTRVIFIPQGEFVAFGALTLASFQAGKVPGTLWLLMGAGVAVALVELVAALRSANQRRRIPRIVGWNLAYPAAVAILIHLVKPDELPLPGPGDSCPGTGGSPRADDLPAGVPAIGRGQRSGAADRCRGSAFCSRQSWPPVLWCGRFAHPGVFGWQSQYRVLDCWRPNALGAWFQPDLDRGVGLFLRAHHLRQGLARHRNEPDRSKVDGDLDGHGGQAFISSLPA